MTFSEPTVFGKRLHNTLEIDHVLTHHRELCTRYAPPPTLQNLFLLTNLSLDIFVDNIHMELSLWDTAGQEEFDRLRSLSYDDTQAIMLCFSVDNKDSLENVSTKWVAEIAEHCAGVKIVLVALKCDLREEHEKDDDDEVGVTAGRHIVSYQEGLEVARRIGALRYLGMYKKRVQG